MAYNFAMRGGMTFHRRKLSVRTARGHRRDFDYTKSRAYVIFDLFAKSVSALGLIILGVIGWRLQQRALDTRDAVESRERQERRYLPMLRSLTELEITLESTAADLYKALPDAPPANTMGPLADVWHEAAWKGALRLRYAATSLYLPDGEVGVFVVVPRSDLAQSGERSVRMPLRAALQMYADWLTGAETFREVPHVRPATLTVDETRGWIEMRTSAPGFPPNSLICAQEASKGSLPAWRIWLNTQEVRGNDIPYPFPPRFLTSLRVEVASVVHDTLQRHPEIADRYVTIRSQAINDAKSAH